MEAEYAQNNAEYRARLVPGARYVLPAGTAYYVLGSRRIADRDYGVTYAGFPMPKGSGLAEAVYGFPTVLREVQWLGWHGEFGATWVVEGHMLRPLVGEEDPRDLRQPCPYVGPGVGCRSCGARALPSVAS